MKTSTKYVLALTAAGVITLVAVAACGGDSGGKPEDPCKCSNKTEHDEACACGKSDCACTIQREFDLTFLGKTIKLVDETGNTSQSLNKRGIVTQFESALDVKEIPASGFMNNFNAIYNADKFISIVINTGDDYIEGVDIEGYKILLREGQLANYDTKDIWDAIAYAVEDMMTPPESAKGLNKSKVKVAGAGGGKNPKHPSPAKVYTAEMRKLDNIRNKVKFGNALS